MSPIEPFAGQVLAGVVPVPIAQLPCLTQLPFFDVTQFPPLKKAVDASVSYYNEFRARFGSPPLGFRYSDVRLIGADVFGYKRCSGYYDRDSGRCAILFEPSCLDSRSGYFSIIGAIAHELGHKFLDSDGYLGLGDIEEGLVQDMTHATLFAGVWRLFFTEMDYRMIAHYVKDEKGLEIEDVLYPIVLQQDSGEYTVAFNPYTSETRFARHLRQKRPEIYAEVVSGVMSHDNARMRRALCTFFGVENEDLPAHLERAMGKDVAVLGVAAVPVDRTVSAIDVEVVRHIYSPDLDDLHANELINAVRLAETYLTEFRMPDRVRIAVYDKGAGAQYSYREGYIIVPLVFFENPSQAYRNAVLVHEFGHFVFRHNLADISPAWSERHALYERHAELYQEGHYGASFEMRRLMDEERTLRGRPGAQKELENLNERIRALQGRCRPYSEQMNKINAQLRKPHFIDEAIQPYEELFADTLSVIAFDDPQIMADGTYRDFTRMFTAKEIAQWDSQDVHHMLDPVRSHIYYRILNNPVFAGRINEILARLFQVIAQEIVARDADPALHSISVSKMNQRLIAAIEQGILRGFVGL